MNKADEYLDLNDGDLTGLKALEAKAPEKKKRVSSDSEVDPDMIYELLMNEKTVRDYCRIKKKSENDILLQIKLNIHWINSMMSLGVPDENMTIDHIFGEFRDFWINEVKAYRRSIQLNEMDPHERYVDFFQNLSVEKQEEHIKDLYHITLKQKKGQSQSS